MFRVTLMSLAMIVCVGCGARTFNNLGNGVAVPSGVIADYAETHGITREEARARLRNETDQQRIAEHANKYGLSRKEAKEQLEYAAR